MGRIRGAAREFLRARDIDVQPYHRSVRGQRQRLWDHYGIRRLVDVGANTGQYASAARRDGFVGEVISIEPLAGAYCRLEAAAAGDPRWTTIRSAVGAASGTVTMRVSEDSVFSSVLPATGDALAASATAQTVGEEVVPLAPLDALVPVGEVATVVKIDVQGFEREVLDGAVETIGRAVLVEMEMSPRPVYAGQMLMAEALARMSDAGFVLALTENLLPEPSGASLQFNGVFRRVG